MTDSSKVYHGKIMLFGEYSVILGSKALVTPLQNFSGRWKTTPPTSVQQVAMQTELAKYIHHLQTQPEAAAILHLESINQKLDGGLWLEGDIPHGYGAGSSGAVVAALYDAFALEPKEELTTLKKELATLEAYFHGNSSGLDPLCCLLAQPLLVENDGHIEVLKPFVQQDQLVVYLYDSQLSGKTAPLMAFFHQQMHHQSFYKKVKQQWIPAVDHAIDGFMNYDPTVLFESLRVISTFELEQLQPMVPLNITEDWRHGLKTGDFTMKLCGSGGGGFSLVFGNDSQKITNHLAPENLIRIL